MTDQGLRCSTAAPWSPIYFYSSGPGVRWPVSPLCQRSPCAGAPGRTLSMQPLPDLLMSPLRLAASSHKANHFHGNGWWATVECWSFEKSYRMPWTLRDRKVKGNIMKLCIIDSDVSQVPLASITHCCILLNPFVLSFTDHLVLPGPFRGSPQRLLYLHLTLSLGSFSVIPTLCMSSSSALMNLRGFTLFLKPGSSIFKIPLFNISTIPVALTWAVPLTSWFRWLSALK